MKQHFPPSPEEPGAKGNFPELSEFTVGKFFVEIRKLGKKKKKEPSPSNNKFYFCFNNKHPELFFQILPPDQMPLKLKSHIIFNCDLIPLRSYMFSFKTT